MKILITPKAEEDLVHIWRIIAHDKSEKTADDFVDKIYHKMGILEEFPQIGYRRPELHATLASLLVKPYIVFYTYTQQTCKIIRILHGACDVNRHI
jgi:plasmid stabilization system protein ParE